MRKTAIIAFIAAILVTIPGATLAGCKDGEPRDHIERVEQQQAQREEEQADQATQADRDAQQFVDLGPGYEPGGLDYSGGPNTDESGVSYAVRWYGTSYDSSGQKIWLVQWSPSGVEGLQKNVSEPNRTIILPDYYLALGPGNRSWGDPGSEYVGKIISVDLTDGNGNSGQLNKSDEKVYLDGWGWAFGVEY
jgi:hypothetical protein